MWPSVQQPISKDKNVMARARKYYLKNNYLTLRSKVKVSWRSLWYVTHRLMVMHPHTKYNWPIWKGNKVMVRTSFAEKKQKKKIRLKQYVSLRSMGRHNYFEPSELNNVNISIVWLSLSSRQLSDGIAEGTPAYIIMHYSTCDVQLTLNKILFAFVRENVDKIV